MNNFPRLLVVNSLASFSEEVKAGNAIARILVTDAHNLRAGTVTSTLTVQGESYLEQNLVHLQYSVTSFGDDEASRSGQMLTVLKLVDDYLTGLGYAVRNGRYAIPAGLDVPEGILECIEWHRRDGERHGMWIARPSAAYLRVVQ